jgi:hypothetical protein
LPITPTQFTVLTIVWAFESKRFPIKALTIGILFMT